MPLWRAIAVFLERLVQEKQRRVGTVTGTSGTQVIVNIDGVASTMQRLATYTTPTAGDTVAIDYWGDRALVLGKIA